MSIHLKIKSNFYAFFSRDVPISAFEYRDRHTLIVFGTETLLVLLMLYLCSLNYLVWLCSASVCGSPGKQDEKDENYSEETNFFT